MRHYCVGGRTRSFCGRCGTHLSCYLSDLPERYPKFVAILLGTVDTEHLENDWLKPERELWLGVNKLDWLKKGMEGMDLPRHQAGW